MRKYTTPTLNITIKNKEGEVVTDLVFDYLLFTIKANGKRIDKTVQYSEVSDGTFKVRYTQEETGAFSGMHVQAEINFFTGTNRVGTLIKNIKLNENLVNEVVE